MDATLGRKVTAEAVGTGLLVAVVVGSGIFAQRRSRTRPRRRRAAPCRPLRRPPSARGWRSSAAAGLGLGYRCATNGICTPVGPDRRLADEGVESVEESGTCCFAEQDKVWVDGPDGAWEIYTVLADSDAFGQVSVTADGGEDPLGCASVPEAGARCCG